MLTPIDIETAEFKKVALGYAPDGVDEFLNKVIVEFERLYKENAGLRDRIKNLEESLGYYKSLEESIKSSIVIAEKAAAETKQTAADQASNIMKKAQLKADELLLDANRQKYQLESSISELKSRYTLLSSGIKGLIEAELEFIDQSREILEEAVPGMEEAAAAEEEKNLIRVN
ncbi:MAG: DivIVA domain-containing protein [Clostridiales bacterium]|nr:DivIVA domain-containing protein [Clostridiales bacterium]